MTSYGFEIACKKYLLDVLKSQYGEEYAIGDLHVVWFAKTLQNYKIIIVDNGRNDRYYECTQNGEKSETYFDIYEKKLSITVKNGIIEKGE